MPESADWYNSSFLILWGSNVPQTRTPDAHFYTEARYKGAKSVVICPDYSEASKFADLWMSPKQGTDAALGMAMGHVILREFHVDRQAKYFQDYARQYTDMPMLVRLVKQGDHYVPERFLRASDFVKGCDETNNPEWKTVAYDDATGGIVVPKGSVGFRWGEKGKWNLEEKASNDQDTKLRLSLNDVKDGIASVGFPYFGNREHDHFLGTDHPGVLLRNVPTKTLQLVEGDTVVASVYDLFVANYGVDCGLGGDNLAKSYDDMEPYTPAWAEKITGVPRDQIITTAREFALNAEKTNGRSMVIVGAGLNHWYHMDMNYRGIINMLVMCGCVGQSGGGWSHYVGQEKLRPQTGWLPLAFGLDWGRPPRQMNSTSAFYAHTDQWRYETLDVSEVLSPTAPAGPWDGALIDYNVRAERMGWLPSAPQLQTNPIEVAKQAAAAGMDAKDYVAKSLKSGDLKLSCDDPDNPANWPRNMFIWRSNLLGASGKGHEYFLKHLLGTKHGVMGKDLGQDGKKKPSDVVWHDKAPEGKLDLLVTLDFRMSTTCMYSDIVLPTASWYEKNDLNTSDMHPFIHPLTAAVDPVWEARSDWEIYKGIAEAFSKVAPEVLGVEKDVVLTPILHDTPGEIAQPFDVKDWKKGEIDPIPGKTMPAVTVVERDYPNLYKRFTSLGPLMAKIGNGGKGMAWNTEHEVDFLKKLNGEVTEEGATKGLARINSDIDACEVILSLAPETNGEVAIKAWASLGGFTGREHTHLAIPKEDEKIRFRDIVAQPRKIISSPIWSGLESDKVCYNAGYTNVHELIPWRTLTGRQQLYQDHLWMRAFGEGFCVYRPPIDTKSVNPVIDRKPNGNDAVVLNFITPHQKWGIHSTYTDNLLMLTLSRGGPCVWISETDAKKAGIVDNDWIEAFNTNGALVARAVVSQRVKQGMCMMYHAQEKIVNVPGSEQTGTARRHSQLGHPHRPQADPHDWWLRPAILRLQLLRNGRIEPRRVRHRSKDVESRLARYAGNRSARSLGRCAQNGARRMKVRAQIAMVLNLDKCIGCHTCSVTCKNVWTNREGMEYAWFNNVETKPGIGYPKDWENQKRWNGGWVRKKNGKIEPKIGSKWRVLANIFANPDLPEIDDYYEPFTFDYEHLQNAPEMKAMPTARPRSLISGERMEKVEWGPNWEEILGGEFAKRSKDYNFEGVQKEMYGEFENTFMMYLPRLCEHCLNPACVAACPSGAIYKREEDGIVLIDQDKCRGWRMCVSGCPYKKIYYNWSSGKSEKCIFCYPRIEAGQPTVCSETCVGRIRYLGVVLYDADRIEEAASVPDEQDLYEAQLSVFLDPNDPKVIEQARADGIAENWLEGARRSPVYKMAMEWKVAFPLHPEYRTMPMVWYVPPLSPIQSAAAAGKIGHDGEMPDVRSLRIPLKYLANLLTAGKEEPVALGLERMLAMRAYMRAKTVDGLIDEKIAERVGLTGAAIEEMYKYMAIANYEDRFVIPTAHRETNEDAFDLRGSCGFSFGNGCADGDTTPNLFGTPKRTKNPMEVM